MSKARSKQTRRRTCELTLDPNAPRLDTCKRGTSLCHHSTFVLRLDDFACFGSSPPGAAGVAALVEAGDGAIVLPGSPRPAAVGAVVAADAVAFAIMGAGVDVAAKRHMEGWRESDGGAGSGVQMPSSQIRAV